jgi:hypothetical protein
MPRRCCVPDGNRKYKAHFPTLFVYRCYAEPASPTPQLRTGAEDRRDDAWLLLNRLFRARFELREVL